MTYLVDLLLLTFEILLIFGFVQIFFNFALSLVLDAVVNNAFHLNPKTPNPDRFDKSNFHAENDFGTGAALFGGPIDLLARFENFL